jgi:DNA-binding response OmpR family regulator/predicted ATPase
VSRLLPRVSQWYDPAVDARYQLALWHPGDTPPLADALRARGCEVRAFGRVDGLEAHLRAEVPDAVLLSGALPDASERLRRWRAGGVASPVLFLREDSAGDFVRASGGWAGPLRADAVLSWLGERVAGELSEPVVPLADGVVDLASREVRRAEIERLTTTEARLLAALAARPGEVRSRDWLLSRVWGYRRGVHTRALDNTVMRLRAKIELDAARPRHVITVRGVGFRFVAPASGPAPGGPPRAEGPLVGRDRALTRALALLEEARLVTLSGPVGVGKSRLAGALAARRSLPVAWCALEGARTHGALRLSAAEALGGTSGGLLDCMAARGALLLVLDGFDGLIGAAAELARWLERAPGLRLLVTSRQRLGLPGERCLSLAPLAVDPAADLYQDRARARSPGVSLDEVAVRALVERLDGLPLAIALAAERVRVLPPGEFLATLGGDLALLDGAGGPLSRVVGGAWALLSPGDRAAWVRLAVFEGDFDLPAAAAVLEAGGLGPALAQLERLVERSVLRCEGDPVRYRMLSVLRAHALERPEQALAIAAARGAHAAHYRALARGLLRPFDWAPAAERAAERGELVRELAALREAGDPAALLASGIWWDSRGALEEALAVLWEGAGEGSDHDLRLAALQLRLREAEVRGALPERLARIEGLLAERAGADTAQGAHYALYEGRLRLLQGRNEEALAALEGALAHDAAPLQVLARHFQAHLQKIGGEVREAERTLRAAAVVARASGRPVLLGRALFALAKQRIGAVDREEVEALLAEALRTFRDDGQRAMEARVLAIQAAYLACEGRGAEAEAVGGVAGAILEQLGSFHELALLYLNLGGLLAVSERPADGRRYLDRAAAVLAEHPNPRASQELLARQIFAEIERPEPFDYPALAERLSPAQRPLLVEHEGLRCLLAGDFAAGEGLLLEAARASEGSGAPRLAALSRMLRASALVRLGRVEEAAQDAGIAERVLREQGFAPGYLHAAARLWLLRPEVEVRRGLLERMGPLAVRVDSPTLRAIERHLRAWQEGGAPAAIPEPGNLRLRWLVEDARSLR